MKPPDEAVWQAWVAKGYAQEKRRSAARVSVAKWVSVAQLLFLAGLWSPLTPYETLVRVVVAAGAMVVMLVAVKAKEYAVAAVSAALVLLYNPFTHAFSFSGEWQRALFVACAVPLVTSLAWNTFRTEDNDTI